MANAKKYILTAITLGLIAAGGALLIAGANMVTRDPIAVNEQKAIDNGLANIFDSVVVGEETANPLDDNNKPIEYITTSYIVKDENETLLGYAFRTDGFNDYGKISLIVGFNDQCVYKGLSVIANEQSFATDLNKGYIKLIEDGEKTINDVDVSCGATYGAKLVKNMVSNAGDAAAALKKATNGGQNG